MDRSPWFWLVGGSNGAGKTTLAEDLFESLPRINPDDVARNINREESEKAIFAAGRQTIRLVRQALSSEESFTVESTLSGNLHSRLIREARSGGWSVGLAYIGVGSPDHAIMRVQERHRRGGHDVNPIDVRRRYFRSLSHLPEVLRLVDLTMIYDNTASDGHEQVLVVRSRRIVKVASPPPVWLARALSGISLIVGQAI